MATRLQITVLLVITLLNSVCNSQITTTYPYTLLPEPPLMATATSQTPPPPSPSQEPISTHTILAPILTNLGFQELAMAVPSLTDSTINSSFITWNGPVTLFAPTDDSIRSCASCSVPRLLKEHIVPGIFPLQYLTKLALGTKLETMNPSHCVTITSTTAPSPTGQNTTKIYIDGVEITHPDLFNDGLVVIHGLQGFVSPLSPSSCNLASSPSPLQLTGLPSNPLPFFTSSTIMRLMLRDAMVRLRDAGYSVLSLAFRLKYAELATLRNMTVFALDDASIFSGGHGYVTNIRFHIVPDRLLMRADLMTLPAGTLLPTLVHGESLVVTNGGPSLRINYVPMKIPDAMYNSKIVVHGIFLPFPHLRFSGPLDLPAARSAAVVGDGIFDSPPMKLASVGGTVDETCDVSGFDDCAMAPNSGKDDVEF